jgi:hypothetical protein
MKTEEIISLLKRNTTPISLHAEAIFEHSFSAIANEIIVMSESSQSAPEEPKPNTSQVETAEDIWKAKCKEFNITTNDKFVRFKQAILEAMEECASQRKEASDEKPQKYEPYFGWCDVSRCKNEGCSGGNAWNDTGYWTVCTKHAASCRAGDPQPKMKQSAIKREKSRDKITGYLPSKIMTNKK